MAAVKQTRTMEAATVKMLGSNVGSVNSLASAASLLPLCLTVVDLQQADREAHQC